MKLSDLKKGLTESVAYTVGLMYPLLKVKNLFNSRYVVGCINHNSDMITPDEIVQHYNKIAALMSAYDITEKIELKANKVREKYSISPKEGFSVILELDKETYQDVLDVFKSIVMDIKNTNDAKIKKQFVRGCFDGRSSYDKTAGYLSLDVDRDHDKQKFIKEIIESLGIKNVNLNQRDINHNKNDQIRIKSSSLGTFMDVVGLYSVRRTTIVNTALGR